MKYFIFAKTIEEAKKMYKVLAMKNHPDKGGNEEVMKAINAEFDIVMKTLKSSTKETKDYTDFINKLMTFNDIIIDIVGTWIWVEGNTYIIKDELKKMGCKYSKQKKCWYKAPSDSKFTKSSGKNLDEIKEKFGCNAIETKKTQRIN